MRGIIATILVLVAFCVPNALGLNDFWTWVIIIGSCYFIYKLYEHEYDDDVVSDKVNDDGKADTKSKDFNRGYTYASCVFNEYEDKAEALSRLRKEYDNGVMFDFTDFDRGIGQFMQDVVYDDYMRKKYGYDGE